MKIKEILLTACSLMACFTACTNEEAIDGPVIADGTINVSFSIDGILTKATNEPGSPAEYTVSKSTVALFEYVNGVPTNCIGFSGADPTKNSKNSYTVSGIDVKSVLDKPVYVLVIANSDNTYTKEMTYQNYLDDIIKTESFDPSSLVKVGGKQHTFTKDASSRTVNVELTQLPARVDVKFAFPNEASGHNCTFEVTSYKVEKVNRWSNSVLPEYTSGRYAYNKASEEVDLSWTKEEEAPGISTFSFYTYEKATASNPVVMTITGELFDGTVTETKTYTLNLNPTTSNGGETNGLIHGHLYDVTGNIDISTKQVTFDVKVKEWEEVNVDANIKDVHYLFVSEHEIHMPNINSYTFEYASDLEVEYEIVSVTYTGYDTNGNKVPGSYRPGQKQYPTINVGNDRKISVTFQAVPTNYVPTHIVLKVKTTKYNLEETVNITHYPTPYVEAWWNNMSQGGVPDGIYSSNKPNHNIFTINSIASGSFKIGDPRDPVTGKTKTDWESNQLVSPRFVIASQWGIASTHNYSDAQNRCYNYKEGPYQVDHSWRMPTLAEIQFINALQYDENSAVKKLLQGEEYWSACQYWYYNISGVSDDNGFSQGNSSTKTFIRCVHDVY